MDIVPTLLDLLGEDSPSHLEGKSLKPLLENSNKKHDNPVFIEWNGSNNGIGLLGKKKIPDWMGEFASKDKITKAIKDPVRTCITPDGWKLNLSTIGEHELYDLNNDPGETVNLYSRNKYKEKIDAMKNKIIEWQKNTKDEVKLD